MKVIKDDLRGLELYGYRCCPECGLAMKWCEGSVMIRHCPSCGIQLEFDSEAITQYEAGQRAREMFLKRYGIRYL